MGESADHAAWKRDGLQGSEIDRRLDRCRERLAGMAPLNLPLDHRRPARQRLGGSMLPIDIDSATAGRLRRIAAGHDATLFQLLAAVYAYWLRSYTEQDDVVFATAHDFRHAPELESMVGCSLMPVVLRISVGETSTCIGLLARMRTEVLDGIGCAVPFEWLLRAIDPPRDQRRNPLFQTALVLEPPMLAPDPTRSIHQLEAAVDALVGQSKLDISIELGERSAGRISGRFIYNSDLFETNTARLMRSHFTRLLRNVAMAPDLPLAELSGPDEQDRRRQLHEFNPKPLPAVTSAQDRCIHELIVDQATRTPDAVAVVVGDHKLSYRDLLGRSQQIAARLTEAGVGPGVVVAIYVDRSVQLVPALLGVLLSGAAYLPLNPNQPERRSLFMIADAGATILLTDSIHRLRRVSSDIEVVDLAYDLTQCCDDMVPASIPGNCSPQDLAYVIYTSGSTGTPKGVQVEHRSVVNLMMALPGTLGLSDADTFVSVVSYTFDGSVGDIFATLALGATLVLATEGETKDPRELAELVECCDATVMSATPTTWSMLIGAGWTGRPGFLAVCAGEPLPDRLARELRQRCRAVWNGWGPTEATVFAGGGVVEVGEPVTVGRPLPGVRIYVMDNRGRLVSCGVPGEIFIAGRGVSRGYVNRPEETAQRYRLDPFVDGDRMYRTGDRGRLLADGRLQHLGRYDDQVKIRGFRIELGEVESVLIEHPDVREVAAAVRDGAGQPQLVAYVVTAADRTDTAQLRRWARGRLPAYMVPHVIVQLSALPMSPSGKLDRAALPAPPVSAAPSTPIPAEPELETTTQRRLAELWSELLPGTVEDPHQDFFELGGDSVRAARLLVAVQRRFGISIAAEEFFEHGTTLAALGTLVDRTQVSGAAVTRQPVEQPRLFFVFPDLATSMSLRYLSRLLEPDNCVYPLITPLLLGPIDQSLTVEEIAESLLRTIRTAQPEGPYRLIGYSFGGLLTYELGRLLHSDGEQVAWLGLLDMPTPAASRQLMRKLKSPSARMARLREVGWSTVVTEKRHNLRWAAREKLIAAGLARRRPSEQFDIRHAPQITCGYVIDGHHLPMNLFVTTEYAKATGSDSLGWAHVHKGPLEIHTVPGHHASLLSETFAGEFSALLTASLSTDRPSRRPRPVQTDRRDEVEATQGTHPLDAGARANTTSARAAVSAVIPALNETRNLPEVARRMSTGIDEIVFVDGHPLDSDDWPSDSPAS